MSAVAPHAIPESLPSLVLRETRRHRRRLAWRWALLATVPILAVLGWLLLRPKPVPLSVRFRSGAVTRGDVVREVRATGHLQADSTVDVGAQISGRIASVLVGFNDPVKAGQVLARFDRTALEAQLEQIEASVSSASTALDQARADAEQASVDLARDDELFAKGFGAPAAHEAVALAKKAADNRVRSAQTQLAAQTAARTLARTNLGYTLVLAPVDGMVIARNVDPGQTIVSALQTPVLFTVAADLHKMQVVAAVDEADIGEVRDGQHATFTVNAYPDRVFDGVVTEVRNAPVIVQDVVTYGTVVEVENADLALKPGMTAAVRVRTADAHGTIRVPTAALRFTPPGEHDAEPGHGVWVVDGAALKRVRVTPGVSDGESTAIDAVLPDGATVLVDLSAAGKKIYGSNHS